LSSCEHNQLKENPKREIKRIRFRRTLLAEMFIGVVRLSIAVRYPFGMIFHLALHTFDGTIETLKRSNMPKNTKIQKLYKVLKDIDSALIAFSGGVDSTFLAAVTQEVLGGKLLAVTVVTPFLTKEEKFWAKETAQRLKIKHSIRRISLPERIMNNHKNRCYDCKKEIFSLLCQIKDKKGYSCVMEGSNQDDLKDYRPGRRALKELHVRSPLLEAGFHKEEIRRMSKDRGLLAWNRPSASCLATRFPYNEKLIPQKIEGVAKAESFLRRLGLRYVRVRLHGPIARIEVEKSQIPVLLNTKVKIVETLKKFGIQYICVDLEGYRSGSMNESILWKK